VAINNRLEVEMEQRQRAEEALRQTHKMEAVGQLSGGIAHDFNNLLMIAMSNQRLLRKRLAEFPTEVRRVETYVRSTEEALDRAAHLTRRLLAFARKQPLQESTTSLTSLIMGMDDLIKHSGGPAVEVQYRLNSVWASRFDANQMENVLINLIVNSRDAMPDGGQIIIETHDKHIAEKPPGVSSEFAPGDYVEMNVIDNGAGMSEEVKLKALDPFYTTKPQGEGTGLGLSMAYGFVSQSKGYFAIESAPGSGTTISIWLPREVSSE
jgi:signal transduction histidine kinase